MDSINTMLIIDIVIVALGIYLFFLSLRMRKNKKVEKFIIAEELLRQCKAEEQLAEYLSLPLMIFSIIMMVGGALMVVHETLYDFGYWYYLVAGAVLVSFLLFYKKLMAAKDKYC